MKQVIYVDVLIFLNTVITFFLLITIKRFTCVKTSAPRLMIASAVGGVYSLILLAPKLNFFVMLLAKSAMGVSIVYIAFRSKKTFQLIKCIALFLIFSFLYAGVVFSVQSIFNTNYIIVKNGSVYFNVTVYSLIIISAFVYCAIWILQNKIFRIRNDDMIYDVVIHFAGREISVRALMDTGNSLRDIYTNQPVIILNEKQAKTLTLQTIGPTPELLETAKKAGLPLRILPVHALSGNTLLPAFTADRAEIIGENTRKTFKSVCVAVTNDQMGLDKYQALINDAFL